MLPEKAAEGWVERTHASGGSGGNRVSTLHVVALTQLASGTALGEVELDVIENRFLEAFVREGLEGGVSVGWTQFADTAFVGAFISTCVVNHTALALLDGVSDWVVLGRFGNSEVPEIGWQFGKFIRVIVDHSLEVGAFVWHWPDAL